MLYSLYFLAVRSTLVFELPLQYLSVEDFRYFIYKVITYTLEPYLVKCKLPLLRFWALIFDELSMKRMFFSLLFSFKCKFTSIPFLFIFLSLVIKIIVETLRPCILLLRQHAIFIDSAISTEDFLADRLFIATCKMK